MIYFTLIGLLRTYGFVSFRARVLDSRILVVLEIFGRHFYTRVRTSAPTHALCDLDWNTFFKDKDGEPPLAG